MANWSVSSWVSNELTGDNVDASTIPTYVDLIITPYTNYVIQKTQFTIGGSAETSTGSNIWINGNIDAQVLKVEFKDRNGLTSLTEGEGSYTSVVGTADNLVVARVYFDSSALGGTPWSMPGNDLNVYIDIDEKAGEKPADEPRSFCIRTSYINHQDDSVTPHHTVTYSSPPTASGQDITTAGPSPAVPTPNVQVEHMHSGTVIQGINSLIFELTFVSDSLNGFYYFAQPTFTITSGSYNSYYSIIYSGHTYDTNGNLTSVVVQGYYTPPTAPTTPPGLDPDPGNAGVMCELGQAIIFDSPLANDTNVTPGSTLDITSMTINNADINPSGETRSLSITGDVGAEYEVTVTRVTNSHTYVFYPPNSSFINSPQGTFTSPTTVAAGTVVDNTAIPNTGTIQWDIEFPFVAADEQYTIAIVALAGSSLTTNVVTPQVLKQNVDVELSLGFSDPEGAWGEGAAAGDIFGSGENTKITLTGRASQIYDGASGNLKRNFSYTIKPAMLDTPGSKTIAPKSTLDFSLIGVGSTAVLTDGAPSGATFDIDSTVGLNTGNTINWSVEKSPVHSGVSDFISVGTPADDEDEIGVNLDNIVVGMIVTGGEIPPGTKVEEVLVGEIKLSQVVTFSTGNRLTFTTSGITVSSITDANTLVASQSIGGVTDDFSLTFGGQADDTASHITGGSCAQAGDNVVISGTLNISSFGTSDSTPLLDINELITITT